ncbi:MAG: hypothetical protein AAFU71_10085 [Cyanobacteria bacterium J06632_22]
MPFGPHTKLEHASPPIGTAVTVHRNGGQRDRLALSCSTDGNYQQLSTVANVYRPGL